jgi:hypothetical protein
MSRSRWRLAAGVLLGAGLTVAATASAAEHLRTATGAGTTAIRGGAPGSATFASPEIRPPKRPQGEEARVATGRAAVVVNRRLSTRAGTAQPTRPTAVTASAAGQLTSFPGINHFENRSARGGNQFSSEPPDQGLCVGNGYVLESVNTSMRVFDTAGNPLSNVTALSEFYKHRPEVDRTKGEFGPSTFDPTCYYDKATNRWFHVAATLHVKRFTGEYTGLGWLDIAVSKTGNPLGGWNLYRVYTTNDGTHGQPNHHCVGGPCFGDYPHIGADANGFYITTNEFSFFGDQYTSAQIYALSKAQLVAGVEHPRVVHIDNTSVGGETGFTVWPAISAGAHDTRANGTEWFLSTSGADAPADDFVGVWALKNTASLNTSHPHLVLQASAVKVAPYSNPPSAIQKPGPTPLRQCLNDTRITTPFGPGCWQYFFDPASEPAHNERMYRLDSSDFRMQQVTYANGTLWGAHGTAVGSGGETGAGIAYYAIRATLTGGKAGGTLLKQGRLAVANANVSYPTLSVLPNGEGAMGFTLVGPNRYPSAAWARVSLDGVGAVHVSGAGVGPADGFSGYKAFGDPPRPRWGDYGASAVDNGTIWLANEYIAQRCTLQQYLEDTPQSPLFTCNNTRTAFANWATRITQVKP